MTTSPIPPAAPVAAPPKTNNTIGLVALILAAVGFVLAIIPATSGFAWLLFAPALILAIVGLAQKGKKKGTSVTALILAVIGWIVAVIVATTTVLVGVGEAISEGDAPPTAASETGEEPATEGEAPSEAAIGDTVTSDDGVAFTVTAVTCGIATAGPEFLTETASGQFCEVRFTLLNGSNDAVTVFSSDITGVIGEAVYESNSTVSTFGDDMFTTEVNPGLSVDAVIYIDIPADAALNFVVYKPMFAFTDGLVVRVS